jgi:hypothetical protein
MIERYRRGAKELADAVDRLASARAVHAQAFDGADICFIDDLKVVAVFVTQAADILERETAKAIRDRGRQT